MDKKVTFSEHVQVKHMVVWKFAYRNARISPWIVAAADRARFERRIKTVESVLNPVLKAKLIKINV